MPVSSAVNWVYAEQSVMQRILAALPRQWKIKWRMKHMENKKTIRSCKFRKEKYMTGICNHEQLMEMFLQALWFSSASGWEQKFSDTKWLRKVLNN
jgi:hypothetical protein